jgi:hypothetical protein
MLFCEILFGKMLFGEMLFGEMLLGRSSIKKTCFQSKSNFITEDHFVQHMNTTIK